MVCPERKGIEPIALNVGDGQVSALQKFINIAPWDHGDVQAVFVDEPVPTAAGSPIGTVGVVDESGFAKKGDHSAGVARQHDGRLGKEDNCQVGVFLVSWASPPAARRCGIISSTCPRVGASPARPPRSVGGRSTSPRRSVFRPSPRSPRG